MNKSLNECEPRSFKDLVNQKGSTVELKQMFEVRSENDEVRVEPKPNSTSAKEIIFSRCIKVRL